MGVNISYQGLEPHTSLMSKLEELKPPSSYSDLRSFFRLCLGLQAFHPRLSHMISPLRSYKNAPAFRFKHPQFLQLWHHTIQAYTTHLWRPYFFNHTSQEPLRLFVDSTSLAHGALLQGDQLVAIWSRLNPQDYRRSNYSELAGFCKAVKGFQLYLINQTFTVYTDNRSVLAMVNAKNHSPFVMRHLAEL